MFTDLVDGCSWQRRNLAWGGDMNLTQIIGTLPRDPQFRACLCAP